VPNPNCHTETRLALFPDEDQPITLQDYLRIEGKHVICIIEAKFPKSHI